MHPPLHHLNHERTDTKSASAAILLTSVVFIGVTVLAIVGGGATIAYLPGIIGSVTMLADQLRRIFPGRRPRRPLDSNGDETLEELEYISISSADAH